MLQEVVETEMLTDMPGLRAQSDLGQQSRDRPEHSSVWDLLSLAVASPAAIRLCKLSALHQIQQVFEASFETGRSKQLTRESCEASGARPALHAAVTAAVCRFSGSCDHRRHRRAVTNAASTFT